MKTTIFSVIALFFTLTSFAQLEQRTWLVGGSGSFYTYTDKYSSPNLNQTGKWTEISLAPSVGYFFEDKFCGGIRAIFSSSKGTDIASDGTISTANQYYLSGGPFLRYYFLEMDKPFNILSDVSYQLGVNQYLGGAHQKGKYNMFSAMTGIEAFFTSSASIEFLLGYSQKITSIGDNTVSPITDTKNGLQASIGFQLHLIK